MWGAGGSRWALAGGLLASMVLWGCSSSSKPTTASEASPSASGPRVVEVTLTDDGCEPRLIQAVAGPTTFRVANDGTDTVTEFELFDGQHVVGEAEHIAKGSSRDFSLTLKAGHYVTRCPGGTAFDQGSLDVATAGSQAVVDSAARQAAVGSYLDYVKTQADQLIARTGPFVAAVKAGDLAKAKTLFAGAREPYEAIEPIAESFGDLDPEIDAREGDVPDDQWGGFHRLEKALWDQGSLDGMAPVADKLLADVTKLRKQVDTVQLEPAQIANGAVELLNEVSTSKVTGEEDRYSHTDLSDFAANVAGSQAAFESVRPLLTQEDADVAAIGQRFTAVQDTLAKYKGNDPAGNGFVLYSALTKDDTRRLSASVDGLAEPLSKVAAALLT
jgi:iron uptake system component EfeO